ncbi:MAG: radical SAM protein [Candidatus Omnitrophota bacterium]|jgi:pyruvate-formate lyase-activating enzyme
MPAEARNNSVLYEGFAICPYCRRIIEAREVIRNGFIYLLQKCPYDNIESEFLLQKADRYAFDSQSARSKEASRIKMEKIFKIGQRLTDVKDVPNWRSINDVFFLLTKKCNISCRVCLDQDSRAREDIPLEFVEKQMRIFKNVRVFLEGGEPTMRGDLKEIISRIKSPRNKIAIITNGVKLSDLSYLDELRKHGLDIAVITLDGFDPESSMIIRGDSYDVAPVLNAVRNAAFLHIETWIQPLILKGVNETQIERILLFAADNANITRIFFNTLFLSAGLRKKGFGENHLLSKDELEGLIAVPLGIEVEYFSLFFSVKAAIINFIMKFFPFANNSMPVPHQLYLKRENGKLLPLLELSELKEIRDIFKRKAYYNFCRYKYLKLFYYLLKNRFSIIRFEEELSRRKVLTVVAGTPRPLEAFSLGYFSDDIIFDRKGIVAVRRAADA